MHHVMWLNNKVPIICGGLWTTKEGLLDVWRMHPNLLAKLDTEQMPLWEEAINAHVANPMMPSAQKLFWRTRLQPEQVTWARMNIYLHLLCTNRSPLSRWIPQSKELIMVSSTPYLGTE